SGTCLTHYTSLSVAKIMIIDKSAFRLSEGSYLNDTSEGRELFNYLNLHQISANDQPTFEEYFSEKPFIGSFVPEQLHNDLTLWRMYGKEDNFEAKGCAITIGKEEFLKAIQFKIDP